MESYGSHKVNVLEYAEAFLPGDMPQPNSLVHAGG